MKIIDKIDKQLDERRKIKGMIDAGDDMRIKLIGMQNPEKIKDECEKMSKGKPAKLDMVRTFIKHCKELVDSPGAEYLKKSQGRRIQEGKMQKGYWVSLHGRAGELDSAFVKDKKGIKSVLIDWASTLSDGDTIKIKKGESER